MTIEGPGGSVNLVALVDSGSDITLVPASVGKIIGFNPTAQVNTFGVSGSASGQIFNARLTLAGETLDVPLFVAISEDAPILIGRAGVWNHISSLNFYNDKQQLCIGNAQPVAFQPPVPSVYYLVGAALLGAVVSWLLVT